MANGIYRVTITHDDDIIGVLNGHPFKEPKIAYTLKRPKEQQFFVKAFKGSLYIRQKDDPTLYQTLLDLLKSSKKCDWFYADIEWQCAGEEFTDFFSGRFSIVSDAKWDFGECTITIKLKPNNFWECIKEHKDVEVGFHYLPVEGIDVPDLSGTIRERKCVRAFRRPFLQDGDFDFKVYDDDDTSLAATNFTFDASESKLYTVVCPHVMGDTNPNSGFELLSGFNIETHESNKLLLEIGQDTSTAIQIYNHTYPAFWYEKSSINIKKKRRTKKFRYYETKWWREELVYNTTGGDPGFGYILAEDYGDGTGLWVREPKGINIEVINNSRRLNDVLVTYFENHPCGWATKTFNNPYFDTQTQWEGIQSAFLNIDTLDTDNNPTGPDQNNYTQNILSVIETNLKNDPYNYAKNYYQNLFVTHKTDVKYPDATDAASEEALKWTWEHIEDIFKTLNLYFWLEEINGQKILRIEHFYYKYVNQEETPIVDITDTDIYKRYIEKAKHTFSLTNNQLPSKETFSWMDEEISAAFAGEDIIYTAACSSPTDSKEIKIKNFTTDLTAVILNSDVLDSENEPKYEFGNDIDDDGFVLISTAYFESETFDEDLDQDYQLKNFNESLQWRFLHEKLYDYNRYYDIGIVNSKPKLLLYTQPIFKSGKYMIPYQCKKHPFTENDFVDINHPIARLGLPKNGDAFNVEPVDGVGEINEISIISSNTGCWMEFDLRWACITEINCDFNDVSVVIDPIKICPEIGGSIYGVAVDLDILITAEPTDVVEVFIGQYGNYTEDAIEDLTNGLFDGNGIPQHYWDNLNVKVVINRLGCNPLEIIQNIKLISIGNIYDYDENASGLDEMETVESDGFDIYITSESGEEISTDNHYADDCANSCSLTEIDVQFHLTPRCPNYLLPDGNTVYYPAIAVGLGLNITGDTSNADYKIDIKETDGSGVIHSITTNNLNNIELVELIKFDIIEHYPDPDAYPYYYIELFETKKYAVCINKVGCIETTNNIYYINIDGEISSNPTTNYTGTQFDLFVASSLIQTLTIDDC